MNAVNATDNELALAMLLFLRQGPDRPEGGWFKIGRSTWLSTRAETKGEYAVRFPGNMDQVSNKKRRK